jgi:hypothetical protein
VFAPPKVTRAKEDMPSKEAVEELHEFLLNRLKWIHDKMINDPRTINRNPPLPTRLQSGFFPLPAYYSRYALRDSWYPMLDLNSAFQWSTPQFITGLEMAFDYTREERRLPLSKLLNKLLDVEKSHIWYERMKRDRNKKLRELESQLEANVLMEPWRLRGVTQGFHLGMVLDSTAKHWFQVLNTQDLSVEEKIVEIIQCLDREFDNFLEVDHLLYHPKIDDYPFVEAICRASIPGRLQNVCYLADCAITFISEGWEVFWRRYVSYNCCFHQGWIAAPSEVAKLVHNLIGNNKPLESQDMH